MKEYANNVNDTISEEKYIIKTNLIPNTNLEYQDEN